MTERIVVKPVMDKSEVAKRFRGKPPRKDDYDLVVREDADVFDENGMLITRFRGNYIPEELTDIARECWSSLDVTEPPSTSRASAAGDPDLELIKQVHPHAVKLEPAGIGKAMVTMADGHTLKAPVSNPVYSYLAGYGINRFTKMARKNRLTRHFPLEWERSLPFFQAIDRFHAEMVPEVHALHVERVKRHPLWAIEGTALSTCTVNVNYESTYHYDVGDFKDGFSTLTVVEVGDYDGGELVLPQYRIALDVRTGGIAVKQSHLHMHGNMPLVPKTDGAKRVSFITYLKHALADMNNRLEGPLEHNEGWHRGKQIIKNKRDVLAQLSVRKKKTG